MTATPERPVLSFLGGTGTVTGSRFLVRCGPATVLVECGLFQGLKALRLRNREPFPVDPRSIDAVVVTHAHIDHSGYVPALVKAGYRGKVHATEDTAALCRILLPDSGHLQEEEAAYANRMGFSRHRPALPLYTEADAKASLSRLRAAPFDQPLEVAPGVSVTFRPAGHILGSAHVSLAAGDRTIVFSGDLGRGRHPLLRSPAPLPAADALLVESTYGNRVHEPSSVVRERLATAIRDTAARGGTVVIPAFAVDRTEMVLHELAGLVAGGRIPALPVFVDSPMALAALRVYRAAVDEHHADVRPDVPRGDELFAPLEIHEVPTVEASKRLNSIRYPAVIVSASGMATGGRVLHHLMHRLGDRRSTVVLVGFQAEGTRGRRLLDGERSLKLLGSYVPVRAEVVDATGMSCHADADELVQWVKDAPSPPGSVFVVHGEPDGSAALQRLLADFVDGPVVVPGDLEQVVV